MPRVVAALLTAFVAFSLLGGVLTLVFFQFRGLAADLRKPKAQQEIHAKARSVYDELRHESLDDLAKVFNDAFHTIDPAAGPLVDDQKSTESKVSTEKKVAEGAASVAAAVPSAGNAFLGAVRGMGLRPRIGSLC